MSVKVVNSGSGVINITAETIPTIKVSSPQVTVVDINPVVTGSVVGPTGPTGATGADGQGVPTGGSQFQILRKVSGTDYDTAWDYADRITIEVRFDEDVSKGDPLYITGFNNGQNRVAVAKADAADPDKMPSIGLAFDDYSQNDNGQVTTIGSLDDVNTQVAPNDFQEGDVLYVKAGGGLTNVKPTGTNLIQNVGKVGRRQQNNGEIVVMAIGRSNDVPNIPSGQAWIGNASGVATPTTLATVATTNSYNDLDDTPTLPAANVDTDLSVSTTTTTVTVISSDGDNATITEATASQAGVMTVDMHDKLDGIAANADVTNSTNVDAAGAIMHSDITVNGFIRRTGAEAYDQITPGTGLSVSAGTLNVADTTLAAVDNTGDVDIKVTGPSGNQDTGVNLDSANALLAIASAANNITFTVDANLASYTNNAGFLTSSSLTTHTFEASGSSSQVVLTSVGADGTSDTVTIDAGANISFSSVTAAGFTVTSTGGSGGAEELNELNDVSITGGLATNDYLVYDGANFTDQSLDISHDTDPDLGGDLDVGDHSIITSSGDKDITLNPHGTGHVNLGTYPIKANDSLVTGDNLKVLTYVHGDSEIRLVSNPQGTVTVSGTPSATQIAAFAADTSQIAGHTGFEFDGSGFTTPNVLVEEGTLSAPGRYGSGARVTKTMFTDANANKTAGDVYVMRSTDSVWTAKADADAVSTASGLLAVAGSTQSASGMVLSGIVRMADNTNFASASSGAILYLDTTDGHVTATKPTGSGKVVRVVGYVVDPGGAGGATNDGVIYFDPSKDWIELSS